MQKLIKTKKILAVILCIVLILTNVNITFANTNYDSKISLEDNSIHLTENSVSDEQDSQSKIDKKINFGTIEKGDTVEPVHFELVNDEDHDIKIKWTETEENSPFNIAVSVLLFLSTFICSSFTLLKSSDFKYVTSIGFPFSSSN